MEECIFCQISKIKTDILFESKHFFVKVGVGILAPGHVMVVSKKHITCFSEMQKQLNSEFTLMKNKVLDKMRSNFSEPIIYEHGAYSQSISHAHIHFVPIKGNSYNLENIKEKLFKDLKSTPIKDESEIINIFKEEGSYFYLEEKGKKWLFHTKGQPEGKFTFRKEFAKLTGLRGLTDWQTMSEEEKLRDKAWISLTKESFRKT